jgi:hypothetical protein
MSERLGRALVAKISEAADGAAWLLVDGVTPEVAEAIAAGWSDDLPRLAVVGPPEADFRGRELKGEPATSLRNSGPVCLVLCEGEAIADSQSIKGFERFSPGELTVEGQGLALLASQAPDVSARPGVPAVLEALREPKLERTPSPLAICRFLDAVAAGSSASEALPELGGFRDGADDQALDPGRVVSNLNLAAERTSGERLRPASLREMRSRAEVMGGVDPGEVIELLIRQDPELLRQLDFDQATTIFEGPPSAGLRGDVLGALERFEERDEEAGEAVADVLPFVDLLEVPLDAKEAAAELLKFNDEHQQVVLPAPICRKLKLLRRERSVKKDSIEEGLLRAIDGLVSRLRSIEVKEPVVVDSQSSEAQARSLLSLAAAHVRMAPLLRALEAKDVEIAGELLEDPKARLSGIATTVDQPARSNPRRVVLAVRGEGKGDAVEVSWTPDAEDFALLMTTVEFADGGSSLSLEADPEAQIGSGITTDLIKPRRAPAELTALAEHLQGTAIGLLRDGFDPALLTSWARAWSDAVEAAHSKSVTDPAVLEALAFAGGIRAVDGDVTLTLLSPLKAEWLAARTDAWLELLDQDMSANAGDAAFETGDSHPVPLLQTAHALGEATAAQYPAFVSSPDSEVPLLPVADGSILSGFGTGRMTEEVAPVSLESLEGAIRKLVDLHPEAGLHLRCIAWKGGAADLLVRAVLALLSARRQLDRAEVVCVEGEPHEETLGLVDDWARSEDQERLILKYHPRLKDWPGGSGGSPEFHLAVVEGVTRQPPANTEEISEPALDEHEEVLFSPRTWVRPEHTNMLLSPPTLSVVGRSWLRLMTAIDDSWPAEEAPKLRVPELRIDIKKSRGALSQLHQLALWVVTLDRFANRKSLEAVGGDVAILHQERRASGSDVQGMVISQKLSSSADHAIEVSLKRAGLLDESGGPELATALRRAAASGYGILALRAATTGSGINELIGHVAAFNRLTTVATPWPLPPGCGVLILSLDEYADWFGRHRRADMLALALSPGEGGVHAANVEVKAVRSGGFVAKALSEAKEQIKRTLIDSRFAAYPNGTVYSRLWLNRICEAAIAVARETGRPLTDGELSALNRFRNGKGVLEWAGVGMVFAPGADPDTQHSHLQLMRDRVPIAMSSIDLTLELLRDASRGNGTDLRTVATGRPVLSPSSKQRLVKAAGADRGETTEEPPAPATEAAPPQPAAEAQPSTPAEPEPAEEAPPPPAPPPVGETRHPVLGVDVVAGTPVEWQVIGPEALSNGHIEVYGTSGAGKTQFIMSLLSQLGGMGARFGVCDFKNDYGDGFPEEAAARFYDLWESPLPFNPLAIENPARRSLQGLRIELRDTVDIAARPFARLGHRQLGKLLEAFEQAYAQAAAGSMPTLLDVHELLDDDLKGVIGDLTGTELFGAGPPLGTLIDHNVIFGLNHIPGTGLTTTLAAGFILSSLYLKLLEMPQVANQVNYLIVIDEAHRVANFHSVASMVRELRSKGLAVILATQRPGDLPEEASTNAQTKVFLRLPDAKAARQAAQALDPSDRSLPAQIRTLEDGEAFVAIAGGRPIKVKLRQHWRDD